MHASEKELTFRNLGFSADEIKLRQRAENFGDPDLWMTKCQADIVLCFFGYGESLKAKRDCQCSPRISRRWSITCELKSITADRHHGW